jgi:hypothetical protein
MTVTLVNESTSMSASDVVTITQALNLFSAQVCQAWGLPARPVVLGKSRVDDWNLCIVDKFPNLAMAKTALGYHEVLNNYPIGYILAHPYGTQRPALGRYTKPITFLGKQLTKPSYLPGLVTVMAHELAEMLIDPQINMTKADSKGRNWLMEVCDHTVGSYIIDMPTYKATPVMPDFTLPSFYDVKGKQPYSLLNVPPMPFYLVPGAYGYYKDANGALHKV